jgi:cation:H+ antiporter
MTYVPLLITGLVLLLAGGASLVRGASGIAEHYGVSPLVVGLTVVAFGTSAPELVVNIIGALNGQTDIAFGNIAGSNLANLGLVLGTAAIITPMAIQGQIIKRELPLLLLATTVLLVMILDAQLSGFHAILDRSDGIILLMLFGVFMYITIIDLLRGNEDPFIATVDQHSPKIDSTHSINWVFVGAGAFCLTLGGQLTIDNGVVMAERLQIAPDIIGLVVIAVGTSLPELVTSIIAAMRREADLCVGNVIGSNIFNTLLVLPVSALVYPLSIPENGVFDIIAMIVLGIVLIPIFFVGNAIMGRVLGVFFVLSYLGYMTTRVYLA